MNEYGCTDRGLKRQVDKWMSGWVVKCINRWLRITLQSAFINSILILLNAYQNFSLSCHLKLNLYEHELHPHWFLISFSDKDTVPLFFPVSPSLVLWVIHSMILFCLLVCFLWLSPLYQIQLRSKRGAMQQECCEQWDTIWEQLVSNLSHAM